MWSVLRAPTVQEEDARRVERELQRLTGERTARINRIGSLLVLHNLRAARIGGRDWAHWWKSHAEAAAHGARARLTEPRVVPQKRLRLEPSGLTACVGALDDESPCHGHDRRRTGRPSPTPLDDSSARSRRRAGRCPARAPAPRPASAPDYRRATRPGTCGPGSARLRLSVALPFRTWNNTRSPGLTRIGSPWPSIRPLIEKS